MNKCILIGRLGDDASLKYTSGGKAVLSFSLAVDEGFGEKKKTSWFKVSVWDKRAESLGKLSLEKGTMVYIEGPVSARTWEAKDGSTKVDLQVSAFEVKLLGGGRRDGERTGTPSQKQTKQAKPFEEYGEEPDDFDSDSIPF